MIIYPFFVRFIPNFNRANRKNCKTGLLRQGVPHGTGNLCGGQFNARIRQMDEIIVADQVLHIRCNETVQVIDLYPQRVKDCDGGGVVRPDTFYIMAPTFQVVGAWWWQK